MRLCFLLLHVGFVFVWLWSPCLIRTFKRALTIMIKSEPSAYVIWHSLTQYPTTTESRRRKQSKQARVKTNVTYMHLSKIAVLAAQDERCKHCNPVATTGTAQPKLLSYASRSWICRCIQQRYHLFAFICSILASAIKVAADSSRNA